MADPKERPILFSAPMVRAILDGRKTQTRRVMKHPPDDDGVWLEDRDGAPWPRAYIDDAANDDWLTCPYGKRGDRLWVRETWNEFDPIEIPTDRYGRRAPYVGCQGSRKISWVAAYAADGPLAHQSDGSPATWRPSIHMPRWASRIMLEITGVRVERLQSITQRDVFREGLRNAQQNEIEDLYPKRSMLSRDCFAHLWESINGKGSWDANPWVWVLEFEKVAS